MTLRKNLKQAELTVTLLADQCQTIRYAWEQIGRWTLQQKDSGSTVDEALVERLGCSIEMGFRILVALEEDISQLLGDSASKFGFWSKGKVVWNESNLQAHRDRIRDQVTAMTLLMHLIQL